MGVLEVFSNPTGYNASYQLLVLVWLQAHVLSSPRPAFLKHGLRDNANPRCAIDELEKAGKLPAARIARIKRIIAAHQNSLDGLPLITAAILAGNQAGLSAAWLNGAAVSYFVLRLVFVRLYRDIASGPTSYIRSIVWWASNFVSFVTLFKAGDAINAK
ncbi:uncharacterized protein LOC62_03G004577 [Vanrija pseudolonga]|uniref:MAPEG family protein n=1 Tax=Vanrija pseudolonga TaxID=143232 RepID=A0AAF0YA88_9TREE|nr:hypothetical protein LOC62_03G004577 [Vanrija pseudolonga]